MFKRKIEEIIPEISHKLIENPSKSVYFNHIHNHCEILLFISGKAEYVIDGNVFKPAPYDLIFIPTGAYHYLIPTDTTPYENYVIGINPQNIKREHYKKLFTPPLSLNIKDDPEIISFFKRLDFYNNRYDEADFSKCALLLTEELITYCSYRKDELNSTNSKGITHIDEIVKYISENIKEPLNADIIANRFSFSKSYVQNLFSQNMHIGIKNYIMQKKIYCAHSDLQKGLSAIEVCEKYSFGDYSSFYRLYKKTFGKSPKNR